MGWIEGEPLNSTYLSRLEMAVTTKAFADSPVTLAATDSVVRCNCTNGNITVNLPGSVRAGHVYVIRKTDSGANTVTVTPNGSETIQGDSTRTLNEQYEELVIQATGSGWEVLVGAGQAVTVSGTADRITVTGNSPPVVDIASTYVGQTSITTVGTLTTLTVGTALTVSAGGITVTGNSTVAGTVAITSTTANQLSVKYDGSNHLAVDVSSAGAVTYNATGASAGHTFSDAVTVSAALTVTGLIQTTLTTQQLALRYDASNHLAVTVGSTGGVTYDATGSGAGHTFSEALTVSTGGITVTGNSTITGTLGGLTGLTVASGGITVTGNSTITGTLGGLTGLTVASGGADVTGNSTVTVTAVGNSVSNTEALSVINTTAAVANVSGDDGQQYSPALRWRGQGWKTNATAASQPVDYRGYVVAVQGTSAPTGKWVLESAVNDGAYTRHLVVLSDGKVGIATDPPTYKLHVTGDAAISAGLTVASGLSVTSGSTNCQAISGTILSLTSTLANQLAVKYDSNNHVIVNVASNGAITYTATGTGAGHTFTNGMTVSGALSTTGQIQVTLTSAAQLSLRYDASNHLAVTVGSTGGVTYDATGSGAGHTFSDLVTASAGVTVSGGSISASGIAATVGALTAAGLTTTTDGVARATDTARLILDGGVSGTGAELILYGGSHATTPGVGLYVAGTHTWNNLASVQQMTLSSGGLLTLSGGLTVSGGSISASGIAATVGALTATSALATGTGGVGYTTGAGGAVTQLTDKSTGVTLNKTCGQITMNNAALGDATTVTFTLTNSTIATTDAIIVVHDSVGTLGGYLVWAHTIGAGSCAISVRNISGGSLSEAIVLNFAVIKGATS